MPLEQYNTPALFYIYMQVHQVNYGFPADCQSWSWYSYIDIWTDAVLSCQTSTFTLFSRWLIIMNCSCNRYAVSSINTWEGWKPLFEHSSANPRVCSDTDTHHIAAFQSLQSIFEAKSSHTSNIKPWEVLKKYEDLVLICDKFHTTEDWNRSSVMYVHG